MTRLVARLILAMLLLPITAALAMLCLAVVASQGGNPDVTAGLLLWLLLYPFIAIYWIALWRDVVRWTAQRKLRTLQAGALALIVAVVVGLTLVHMLQAPGFAGVVMGGSCAPIVWVLVTVLIWRETPQERMERIRKAGTHAVCCAICGYNMTGLREARCPECGAQFTLDELLTQQHLPDQSVLPEG